MDLEIYRKLFDLKFAKGEQKKLVIIEAAIESMAIHGFGATSFGTIGKLCDMSTPHIRYYFKNKDELLADAIKVIVATAQEATIDEIKKSEDWCEQIMAMARGAYLWQKANPQQSIVLLQFYAASSHNELFRTLYIDVRQAGKERIAGILESSPQPFHSPIECLAPMIQDCITGALVSMVIEKNGTMADRLEALQKTLKSIISSELNPLN